MLYNLLYPLHTAFSVLNVFKYITFRAIMAALTAFIMSLVFGPLVIKKLKELQVGEYITKGDSDKLDSMHSAKQGTPTMGGIFILIAIFIATLLWADLSNRFIWIALFATTWLGVTGFLDDYMKLTTKKKGIKGRVKLISQVILGLIVGSILFMDPAYSTQLDIPFLKNISIDLGILYVFFVALVITGSSNAVNLTDGLDGLAVGCVVIATIAYSVLSYLTGNIKFSDYLLIPYIRGAGELTVFCASIIGAGLGFLWFNCFPAAIFMGDVGSLALGGALGTVAVLIKKEFLLMIVGGIFVMEAMSVILQVASFKLFKKRIFKIAPLHHHFQFLGWKENKVIVRFWILAIIFAFLTLVTLKTR
ncbi:MAG TPA: phospho-N-acetylmuramoyl-pentapeptide-transferase [Candidatus Omnitrophota bacterium]|nr:phospho-N-acetylmuramoyl-pentapeptide-transferase [Candidatus Omnitrophota bacterium]HPT06884.1 phospho-N-acetylmuramoyl-pentapeptide-transferase [Candidatus Omnitrophota bacterium]